MIRAAPYAGDAAEWNDVVARSRNGTFLFDRGYMEYHADRFQDCSFVFYEGSRPVAVFPASRHGSRVVSHGGLTYGGVVSTPGVSVLAMQGVLELLTDHLHREGVTDLLYKPVHHIYHRLPAEDDLYVLHRLGAVLDRRDVSTAIAGGVGPAYDHQRRAALARAAAAGLTVSESHDFDAFMVIVAERLRERYGAAPVHTAAELRLLADRFPDNIRLFGAFRRDAMLGGVVIYQTPRVAHAQYIAATEEGRQVGATDAVFDHLLGTVYRDHAFFDFGTAMEPETGALHEGLVRYKESFGARAICYDHYRLSI